MNSDWPGGPGSTNLMGEVGGKACEVGGCACRCGVEGVDEVLCVAVKLLVEDEETHAVHVLHKVGVDDEPCVVHPPRAFLKGRHCKWAGRQRRDEGTSGGGVEQGPTWLGLCCGPLRPPGPVELCVGLCRPLKNALCGLSLARPRRNLHDKGALSEAKAEECRSRAVAWLQQPGRSPEPCKSACHDQALLRCEKRAEGLQSEPPAEDTLSWRPRVLAPGRDESGCRLSGKGRFSRQTACKTIAFGR